MYKRIISFVLVIAILFCFAVPYAFAATEYRSKAVTWGDFALTYYYNYADDVWNEDSPLPWFGTAIKGITTALNSKICEQSHDGYHASLGESISHEAFGMDDHGRYCLLSCNYCGEWFRCYSSDLIAAHDEYVASLDSTTVGSGQKLSFNLSEENVSSFESFLTNGYISEYNCSPNSLDYVIGKNRYYNSYWQYYNWDPFYTLYISKWYSNIFNVTDGSYSLLIDGIETKTAAINNTNDLSVQVH